MSMRHDGDQTHIDGPGSPRHLRLAYAYGHCEHHSISGNRARTLGACFLFFILRYQQFIIVKSPDHSIVTGGPNNFDSFEALLYVPSILPFSISAFALTPIF